MLLVNLVNNLCESPVKWWQKLITPYCCIGLSLAAMWKTYVILFTININVSNIWYQPSYTIYRFVQFIYSCGCLLTLKVHTCYLAVLQILFIILRDKLCSDISLDKFLTSFKHLETNVFHLIQNKLLCSKFSKWTANFWFLTHNY